MMSNLLKGCKFSPMVFRYGGDVTPTVSEGLLDSELGFGYRLQLKRNMTSVDFSSDYLRDDNLKDFNRVYASANLSVSLFKEGDLFKDWNYKVGMEGDALISRMPSGYETMETLSPSVFIDFSKPETMVLRALVEASYNSEIGVSAPGVGVEGKVCMHGPCNMWFGGGVVVYANDPFGKSADSRVYVTFGLNVDGFFGITL